MNLKLAFLLTLLATNALAEEEQACLPIHNEAVDFGHVDKALMREWAPNLRYVVNPEYLSVVNSHEDFPALRQKFVPNHIGTDRVIAAIDLEGRQTYAVSQSVLFEDGFDWGGIRESGKFGFGLGGGSVPTGGRSRNDGLSARLVWQGNGDGTAGLGVYVYSADRSQNLPYGDVFDVENFLIPVGEWFRVTLKVTANSSIYASDGSLSISLDDEVVLFKDSIRWQGAGTTPMVDRTMYSTFYGGNTSAWAPDYTTHAQFANVCLTR